ncbi:succinate dehydrogenase/fumarate reductase iron-sulfur subunit [Blattabacterium cuenoti]|uniref:Succinate dehydrogenase/fumarate reductase iron-sulfur subunit n=1 Tax=Blattabacterium cuenoti BPAY TaxID=1457031 RepID=A0ABM7EYW7_9FLAO|nr:succinate dehydrogenase/fumarate reductase iron-sulfur subunit [Blattabacterium cuenoti]BAR92208.1 succinate dehydrogenase/fumarate reductase iron-sulfur subunit [Blattabacterium cuenoti BPAY]
MNFKLKIWRQKNSKEKGYFKTYQIYNISSNSSFLEMLDILNNQIILCKKKDSSPISFDHDCREGICGMCSLYINGRAHGPDSLTTTCQLHMRHFHDGETIYVEPWRAKPFPIIKDLIVDRSSFDRIIISGGYISVNTFGKTIDGNMIPISKYQADKAFDAATCIGCGACVAVCKNRSAMLFVSAKVSQFALLPQGKIEKKKRVLNMIKKMDEEGFGSCTNTRTCEVECPKGISTEYISFMNREYIQSFTI